MVTNVKLKNMKRQILKRVFLTYLLLYTGYNYRLLLVFNPRPVSHAKFLKKKSILHFSNCTDMKLVSKHVTDNNNQIRH